LEGISVEVGFQIRHGSEGFEERPGFGGPPRATPTPAIRSGEETQDVAQDGEIRPE
jgi:hypothetical protein